MGEANPEAIARIKKLTGHKPRYGTAPDGQQAELTVAFLLAYIDDLPPEAGLDDSLPAFVRFVLQFQKIESEALAPQEWFMT